MKYLIPNVGTAFRDYLNTDIPNVTATLKQIRDYTAHRDEFDEYPSLRAMTTVINWKSNVSGSDLTHNFRTALEADMVRGDMFYDPASRTIGLVNWYVDRMVDCLRTQITECNVRVSVEREQEEILDPGTGQVLVPGGPKTLVDRMPAVYYEMYGRYDFTERTSTPGVFPDQEVEIRLQMNPETGAIQSGDTIMIRGIEHVIEIVNRSQLNMDGTRGVLSLICKRTV